MGRGRNSKKAQQPQLAEEENDDAPNDAPAAAVHVHWDVNKLAELWESDNIIRSRGREQKCLTRWLSSKTKGIASMRGIYLNAEVLLHVAKLWCPLLPTAKESSHCCVERRGGPSYRSTSWLFSHQRPESRVVTL